MRYAPFEERVLRGGFLVGVGVERVSREFCEMQDILERDLAGFGVHRLADLELLESLAERVHARVFFVRAARPAVADRRDRLRRSLDRCPLHVVLDPTHATHLLAAPGATRTAVHEVRQRRPVPGRLGGAVAIDDDHAAMVGGRAENKFAGDTVVAGHDGTCKTAFAHARQLNGFVERVIGQNGANRAKRLDGVHRARAQRLIAVQQRRHEERAFLRAGTDDFKIVAATEHELSLLRQFAHTVADFIALALACEGAHIDILARRVADAYVTERAGQRLVQVGGDRGGRDNAPDRRALLSGLAGHLAHDLFDKQVELGRARNGVRAKDGRVQRIGLGRKRHRLADHAWVLLQVLGRAF